MIEINPIAPNLSFDKAATLLFLSFGHAQGNHPGQENIYRLFKIFYPEQTVSKQYRENLYAQVLADTTKYISPGTYHQNHKNEASINVNEALMRFGSVFNSEPYPDQERLVGAIASDVISMDLSFYNQGGREKNPPMGKEHLRQYDRWDSHFKKYVLDGEPTGAPEYQQLYDLVRRYWLLKLDCDNPRWRLNIEHSSSVSFTPGDQLSYVAQIWEQRHNGQPYFLFNQANHHLWVPT